MIVIRDTSALLEPFIEEEHSPDVQQAAAYAEVRLPCFDSRLRKAALALGIESAG